MKSLSLSRPHLIVMVGIPGAGKSFFGDHFAQTFNAPVINEKTVQSDIFGSVTTNKTEATITHKAALSALQQLFKTKQTVIYEGVSSSKSERKELTKLAHSVGYHPMFIWVQTESYEAKRRAMLKTAKPRLTSDEFDQQIKKFSVPDSSEKFVVISGKHTYASQLKIVLKYIAEGRSATSLAIKSRRVLPTTRGKLIR
jgi:predicted kinase